MKEKRNFISKNLLLFCFILCLVTLMLGRSNFVYAQEDGIDEFMLEEIVVTAEKREAELQQIPMDVSVVRPDEMLRLNIHQVEDLDKMLPELTIDNMASSFLRINIREVQQQLWNPTYETTVAVHLDGIQLTRVNGLENKFYDLERVEMLKGPQGTLYGRGSTAGSMNMVTRKPELETFGGDFEVEYGNYDQYRFQGAMNIPIVDKLAIRLAGRRITRDGYVDAGFSDNDAWSGRISMKWEPTDRQSFSITVDADGSENKGYLTTGHYLDVYGGIEIIENPNLTNPASPDYNPSVAPYAQGSPIMTPYSVNWWLDSALADIHWNDNNSWGIAATYDHELDWAYFTAQYGHRSLHERKQYIVPFGPSLSVPTTTLSIPGIGDFDIAANPNPQTQVWLSLFDPPAVFATDQATSGHFDSIEIRLASKTTIPNGDKLEWIIGTMYMDDVVGEWAQLYENIFNNIRTQETALFGQASWMPIDRWNLTAGYRYAWDKKDYEGVNLGIGVPPDPSQPWVVGPTFLDPTLFQTTQNKWNEPSYKFNLAWIATDDIMSYLNYAKGYKTGNVDRDGRAIPPEFLDAWELGFKSRFLNSRLQVNMSVYYYLYDNYNNWFNVYDCVSDVNNDGTCEDTNGNNILDPADYANGLNISVPLSPGGTEQKGLNASIMWLATQNDTFTLTGSWSKNEYDDYYPGGAMLRLYPTNDSYKLSANRDQSGEEFGGSPIRVNMGYIHTWFIGRDTLMVTGNLFYTGDAIDQVMRRGEPDQYTMPGNDAYILGDVSVNYTSSKWLPPGFVWHLRFWCNNVWDSDDLSSRIYSDSSFVYMPNFINTAEFAAGTGTVSGSYVQPRTMGITFGVTF
jgi:iron complex outermembrane receptor protein